KAAAGCSATREPIDCRRPVLNHKEHQEHKDSKRKKRRTRSPHLHIFIFCIFASFVVYFCLCQRFTLPAGGVAQVSTWSPFFSGLVPMHHSTSGFARSGPARRRSPSRMVSFCASNHSQSGTEYLRVTFQASRSCDIVAVP